jgi:hypothetical protein
MVKSGGFNLGSKGVIMRGHKIFILFSLAICLSCGKTITKQSVKGTTISRKSDSPSNIQSRHEKYGDWYELSVEQPENKPIEFTFTGPPVTPFGPSTTFRFTLPESCSVNIIVKDVTERQLDSTDFGYRQAGSYMINWNPSNFRSGIYFIKLTACDSTREVKYTLLK